MPPDLLGLAQTDACAHTEILAEIKRQVGRKNFDHWFQSAVCSVTDNHLTVGVASPFLLSWMQKQFRQAVTKAAESLVGPSARVTFEVDARAAQGAAEPPKPNTTTSTRSSGTSRERPAKPETAEPPVSRGGRRRFADLADFVQGECNDLAVTATQQVCSAPGSKWNPLYIHGGVGVGKTHLLEGIYRSVRKKFPKFHTLFLTAEAFTNYFTQALRERTTPSFRQRFRNVDVLLVDDIDFLNGKRGVQEEFLHTFKQLESHGCQIVLAADCHPRLLDKLNEELTTRFLSGLVCRIESPDLETRKKILERRSKKMDASISTEALRFVAELIGALNCLETFAFMTGKRVSLAAARTVLADLERDCVRIVRMSDVEQTVCQFFGVKPEDLKSARRHRAVSQPRMLAMFLARKFTQAAYNDIGRFFGGRNHSTVITAEKRVLRLLDEGKSIRVATQDWPLSELILALEKQLQAS
jgi:chromosomal replication initiator protein